MSRQIDQHFREDDLIHAQLGTPLVGKARECGEAELESDEGNVRS